MEENKSFKQSMDRLDTIVNQLESKDIELEVAIKLFEEGLTLIKNCDKQLNDFEDKIGSLINTYRDGESNA